MVEVVDLSLARAAKADELGEGASWRPRDALVELLSEIDAGKIKPYGLIISFAEKTPDGGVLVDFRNSCPDGITAQGILSRVAWRLNNPE